LAMEPAPATPTAFAVPGLMMNPAAPPVPDCAAPAGGAAVVPDTPLLLDPLLTDSGLQAHSTQPNVSTMRLGAISVDMADRIRRHGLGF
jgi:hypothetical protein